MTPLSIYLVCITQFPVCRSISSHFILPALHTPPLQRLRYAPLRIPTSMSLNCAECVSALLCRNPAERLGAGKTEDIKNHDFFVKVSAHTRTKPTLFITNQLPQIFASLNFDVTGLGRAAPRK